MVARVARIRGNRLQIVTDGLPEILSCAAILGVALICRRRLLKPLAEALSDKTPALTARGSLSYYALIYTGYPRATYGGLGILHVYEHLSGPSFIAPANTLVSTAAGVFSSPAPVVPIMPKTLL